MKIITYNVLPYLKDCRNGWSRRIPIFFVCKRQNCNRTSIRERCSKHWAISPICIRHKRKDIAEWLYLRSRNRITWSTEWVWRHTTMRGVLYVRTLEICPWSVFIILRGQAGMSVRLLKWCGWKTFRSMCWSCRSLVRT